MSVGVCSPRRVCTQGSVHSQGLSTYVWSFIRFTALTWRHTPEVDLRPGVVGRVASVRHLNLVVRLLRGDCNTEVEVHVPSIHVRGQPIPGSAHFKQAREF